MCRRGRGACRPGGYAGLPPLVVTCLPSYGLCIGLCLPRRHPFPSYGLRVLAIGRLEQSGLVAARFDALLSAVSLTSSDQGGKGL